MDGSERDTTGSGMLSPLPYTLFLVPLHVPRTRLELAHLCRHQPLKLACLPISPPGQPVNKQPRNIMNIRDCKIKNFQIIIRLKDKYKKNAGYSGIFSLIIFTTRGPFVDFMPRSLGTADFFDE